MIIKLNNKFLYLNKNTNLTIFQLCLEYAINIPNFCYFEKLSIAGNCRMCIVEILNAKNLIVSCATKLLNNMQIFTSTIRVKKARKGIIEFLLINHPLDCPICDQGGECDLQDITLIYGSFKGRFYENFKRSKKDENFGPLINSIMTRCIHCTRCVRFLNEVSGSFHLGLIGRGFFSQISTYKENFLIDELSGNIIDLCPVGALTSKPYSFKSRP
jgi:NADH dehydrogenase/NADH:ubiquinone oxidoreductase subunit G